MVTSVVWCRSASLAQAGLFYQERRVKLEQASSGAVGLGRWFMVGLVLMLVAGVACGEPALVDQVESRTSLLHLGYGVGAYGRQDQVFSPMIHGGFGAVNVALGYEYSGRLRHAARAIPVPGERRSIYREHRLPRHGPDVSGPYRRRTRGVARTVAGPGDHGRVPTQSRPEVGG